MNPRHFRAVVLGGLSMLSVGAAIAQDGDWFLQCFEMDVSDRSLDHLRIPIFNPLMRCAMGVSGTATYGAPCYAQAFTFNLPGRIGFQIGNTGSIQDLPENQADPSNVAFHDDNMVITTGMPDDPGGTFSYATVTRNGGRTLIGTNGLSVWFRGESGRYMVFETTNGDTHIQMTADIVADAVRLRWVLTNTAETNANIGLWYGASLGMLTEDFTVADRNGASQSHLLLATNTHSPKIGYVTTPSGRPPVTEQRYTRAIDPSGFPQIVDFLFSQTAAYGLRVDNGETPNNLDPSGQLTASEVGEFVLGNHGKIGRAHV